MKGEKTGLENKKQVFEDLIKELDISAPTKENIIKLYMHFGFDAIFARADVMKATGLTATPSTELMRKLKKEKLIESAMGRGKYKFVELNKKLNK